MIETVLPRTWSMTRIRKHRRCTRLYRWQYEVAPRGRSSDAPADVRLAWVLSRMTDLPSLVNEVVRSLAAESLVAARSGDAAAVEPGDALHRLRAAWKDAREHWAGGPPSPLPSPERHRPISEVFYGEEGPALRDMAERAPRCVEAWQRSELLARLIDAPDSDLLWLASAGEPDDERPAFREEDLRLHAAPDLVWRRDGVTEIVEWRTGPEEGDESERRAAQGLWTAAMLGVDPGSLVVRVVHLHDDAREEDTALDESDLHAAAENIRRDLVELESASGPVDSIPRLDVSECLGCHFRAACWPERFGAARV